MLLSLNEVAGAEGILYALLIQHGDLIGVGSEIS